LAEVLWLEFVAIVVAAFLGRQVCVEDVDIRPGPTCTWCRPSRPMGVSATRLGAGNPPRDLARARLRTTGSPATRASAARLWRRWCGLALVPVKQASGWASLSVETVRRGPRPGSGVLPVRIHGPPGPAIPRADPVGRPHLC
jgi:hypothetical protein